MTNENDSNADLDINLDEFDLESSDADLSLDSPTDPAPESAAQSDDDDSIELDDLFGDSDDDFNFSKKEEISLDFDGAPETVADAQQDAPAMVDSVTDAIVNSPDEFVTPEIVAPEMVEPDESDPAQVDQSLDSSVEAAAVPTAPAKKKGFLSKLLGIFSRTGNTDNYGEDYSEFGDDEPADVELPATIAAEQSPIDAENDVAMADLEEEAIIDPDVVEPDVVAAESAVDTNRSDVEVESEPPSPVAEDDFEFPAEEEEDLSNSTVFAEASEEFLSSEFSDSFVADVKEESASLAFRSSGDADQSEDATIDLEPVADSSSASADIAPEQTPVELDDNDLVDQVSPVIETTFERLEDEVVESVDQVGEVTAAMAPAAAKPGLAVPHSRYFPTSARDGPNLGYRHR